MHNKEESLSRRLSCSALILAGGKSSRFGTDKAFIPFGRGSLIEHIIEQLEPHFTEIIISAKEPAKYNHINRPICTDLLEGAGPMGGIHAGLKLSANPYLFVTACDMPYPSGEIIAHLKTELLNTQPGREPDAVVLGRDGFIEPFHGMYSQTLIPGIEESVESGITAIYTFLRKMNTRIIDDSVIDSLCPDNSLFLNINKKEDLEKINSFC